MFSSLLKYQYLQNAVMAGLLACIVCGIIGVIIVEKRLVMMSGGIAHTSYGGVGLGYLIGIEPIIGAFIFSILASLGIGFIRRRGQEKSDTVISLLWSLGMALGILFVGLRKGYPPDLSSYLFGNILSVTRFDLLLIFALTLIVVIVIFLFFNSWKAYLFDEEFARIAGMKTALLEYILLALIAMTIVVLIRVVGIIMALALLTAPAAISALIVRGLKQRMLASIVLGGFFIISGLWISYELKISSGASIVIVSVISYIIVYVFSLVHRKISLKKSL